jgi:hypothetical protein
MKYVSIICLEENKGNDRTIPNGPKVLNYLGCAKQLQKDG